MQTTPIFSRRQLLATVGTGIGYLALPELLQADASSTPASANPLAPRSPHFAARAKHIVHVYLNGGPSQVDTWDYRPELQKWGGKKLPVPAMRENLLREEAPF